MDVIESPWQIQDHRKILLTSNFEKGLSADATVVGAATAIS